MLPTLATPSLPARLAGFTAPVSRATYLAAGFGLMGLKYATEAAVALAMTGKLYSPIAFLSPILSLKAAELSGMPDGMFFVWVLWNLPFAWVGTSMSVRRAQDAGMPGAVGLGFLFPFTNFLLMAILGTVPSRPAPESALPLRGSDRVVWAALAGVGGGAAIGLGMTLLMVYGLGEYGGALFMGTPVMMGTVAGFLLNLRQPQSLAANLTVGALTVGISGGLLMLFALEGALCLAMAAPICLVMSLLGVGLGRALARVEGRAGILASHVALPIAALIEPAPTQDRMVESRVVIAAPPEAVWDAVVGFGGVELPPPPEWYFNLGIAYPQRARIEGEGPGAVRYCEFSTGPFVEPIHTWNPPFHLGFDVTESPPTMHEWSPYAVIHAPHLDGILKSKHGEFRIQPRDDGTTELIGRTWYTFDMAPEPYWGLWSDAAIHAIHARVLRHIAGVAEAAAR